MSFDSPDRAERAQRRAARRQARSGSPALQLPEVPPRLRWARLEIASDAQVAAIEATARHRLQSDGVRVPDPGALTLLAAHGARIDRAQGRVWLDPDPLERLLALAPSRFTWLARNPARTLTLGDSAIAFGLHGHATRVYTETGPRPAQRADLEAALRLGQVLGALHVVGQPFAQLTDVSAADLPVEALTAALTLTDKPLLAPLHDGPTAHRQLAVLGAVFGPLGALAGAALVGEATAAAPLTWDAAVDAAIMAFARSGQAVLLRPFQASDGEAPAEAWARQHAEVLAGVALAQAAWPGAPVLYGGLRGAQHGPAAGLAAELGARLARFCALPAQLEAAPRAGVPGAEAAAQSGWALWPAVLGGVDLIATAAGCLADGAVFSPEHCLSDVDGLGMFRHFLAGFDVDPETLALAEIKAAGPGGHHLDSAFTRARYTDAFYPSFLADRLAYETWELAGRWDTVKRAAARLPDLLAAHTPPALTPEAQTTLTETLARLRATPERGTDDNAL
ncbi:MAG: trimethylamine methyltransferase family protein [Anaerolineales bacterium]|nr:trimethylamine methyltransferase family protein [Anaerolineales bacterium]